MARLPDPGAAGRHRPRAHLAWPSGPLRPSVAAALRGAPDGRRAARARRVRHDRSSRGRRRRGGAGDASRGRPGRRRGRPGAPLDLARGTTRDSRSGTCWTLGPRVYFAGDTGPFDGPCASSPAASTWRCCRSGRGARTVAPATSARGRPPRRSPTSARPWRSRSTGGRSIRGGSTASGRRPLTEPGDRFAEHAARLAPATTVRVLRPGEGTSIESTP